MKLLGAILDLDMTLVNTDCLADLRQAKANPDKWKRVYARIPETTLYQGALGLIELLGTMDFRVGIVTTSPASYATRVMDHHGIKTDALVGYHDATPKPSSAPMILCAQRLQRKPEECIAIGDNPNDIIAGRAAGMVTMAATWGCVDQQSLLAAEPDYVANSPDEAGQIIMKLVGYE